MFFTAGFWRRAMAKESPEAARFIVRMLTQRRWTRVVVELAREVERLDEDNAPQRAARGFYRKALAAFLCHLDGRKWPTLRQRRGDSPSTRRPDNDRPP
jgi:hypothetical protein